MLFDHTGGRKYVTAAERRSFMDAARDAGGDTGTFATTAWTRVKVLMRRAGVGGPCAVPKGLRHGFAVEGTSERMVPLNVMQKWLGHARIETTAIYANALGKEERELASRTWL